MMLGGAGGGVLRIIRIRTVKALLIALGVAFGTHCAAAADQHIVLNTPSGDIAGSLRLPAAPAKPPVALIIAGSGPTDRDGNSSMIPGSNDSLKMLAAALAQEGYASVRYDKRGIGASRAAGPAESVLRFDHYVDDAAAWVRKLTADPRFDGVAIIGHSEGALIAVVAAQRSPARAVVSIAGVADRPSAVLRTQLEGKLPPDLKQRSDQVLAELDAGRTVTDVPPALHVLYRPSVQPYLVSWFRIVPTDAIAKLSVPCLIVQGDTDIQVSTAQAAALQSAQPACKKHVVAGMNHVLKAVPADTALQIASYGDPALPLAEGLMPALIAFLNTAFAPAAAR